ncbi:MAG TPA: hypothetical protein PJ993_00570 [Candidatus Saccharibacteria bacterium]|nr:hypothetical protein [Candidatus Saccharibacteria bacterium]HMT39420.1 hypothetical protein [Candidatus Saccharibacteria bacterium]
MAKKRTSKSKSSLNKKSSFFTKRKIALGVALIALIGIGVVLYSNAAVGDQPVEKTLYCNQGNCFATRVEGTQRAPLKALVRDTNRPACASTGKEWILKKESTRKQAAGTQWICLKGNSSTDVPLPPDDPTDLPTGQQPNNPPNNRPSGFVKVESECFKTFFPRGVQTTPSVFQVGGAPNNCLQRKTYEESANNVGSSGVGSMSINPLVLGSRFNVTAQDVANNQIASSQQLGEQIVTNNPNFSLGGKQAIFLVRRNPSFPETSKVLHIYIDNPYVINGVQVNGFELIVSGYGNRNENGRYVKTTTDTILDHWQWK